MLILGRAPQDELLRVVRLHSPLVPVGSWVIVEDTIVNGNPVWPGMGPGPAEAVGSDPRLQPRFVTDPQIARLVPQLQPARVLQAGSLTPQARPNRVDSLAA